MTIADPVQTQASAACDAGSPGRPGRRLPVRLRAWDGSEAGPADAPVLVVRSPRALSRILWRPGELGLARAYVSGDLDVDGDLTEGLRRSRPTSAPVSPAARRWAAGPAVGARRRAAADQPH